MAVMEVVERCLNTRRLDIDTLSRRVSLRRIKTRTEELWGSEFSDLLNETLEDLFIGSAYDSENPREVFVDPSNNALQCVTYRRPKGFVGADEHIRAYQVRLPSVFDVGQIDVRETPVFDHKRLYDVLANEPKLLKSNAFFFGLTHHDEVWLSRKEAAEEVMSISSKEGFDHGRIMRTAFMLCPDRIWVERDLLPHRRPRKQILPTIRSAHKLQKDVIRDAERYCKALGLTPVYAHYKETGGLRHIHMFFGFDYVDQQGTTHAVTHNILATFHPRISM